jgi:hypothetical protein
VRTVYIGSSEFSLRVLGAAAPALAPALVVTRPAAEKGRGRLLAPTPLAAGARELGLTVLEPALLADAAEQIDAVAPEVIVLRDPQRAPIAATALARGRADRAGDHRRRRKDGRVADATGGRA